MDPSTQLFQLEWMPRGDELFAMVALPNGAVEIRLGIEAEKIQPAPGMAMIDIHRWAFGLFRDGHRLSSGGGRGIDQSGIFRSAYKAVLRVAAMESLVGTCPVCSEHTYPQQRPDKNGSKIEGKDDRIVCPKCNNDQNKRISCRACYTIGYLYRPDVADDLRCIDKECSSRQKVTP